MEHYRDGKKDTMAAETIRSAGSAGRMTLEDKSANARLGERLDTTALQRDDTHENI